MYNKNKSIKLIKQNVNTYIKRNVNKIIKQTIKQRNMK